MTQEKCDVVLVVKGVFHFKKCFMCTISTRNISSPNSLKMWKLCEHTTSFIDNVFIIISNVILCYVVLFLSQFDFLDCVCSFIFSFLVVYVQNSKKWLNTQLQQQTIQFSVKGCMRTYHKNPIIVQFSENVVFIWIKWLCPGVQRLPTTTENITKLKTSIPTWY